jgi:nucleotide-binding universal stress UspA family protein
MRSVESEVGSVPDPAGLEEIDPLGRSAMGVEQLSIPPLIVAVDGGEASVAALRVAAELADRDGTPVEAVLREGVAPAGSGVSLCASALREAPMSDRTRMGRVRRQLCAILETHPWSLHVEFGSFGPTVTDLARSTAARLIVMGLNRHRPARRLLGRGAVARVLPSAPVPVLAVAATARALPHVALAAVDFSPASVCAAIVARDLLAQPGTLQLVYVHPDGALASSELEGTAAILGAGISPRLKELAADLAVDGVTVDTRLTSGDVVERLLIIAREKGAELVACGVHGTNAVHKLPVSHTPLALLRRAECSILIAPSAE